MVGQRGMQEISADRFSINGMLQKNKDWQKSAYKSWKRWLEEDDFV